MVIKVTRTEVWYVETEEYTVAQLRKDDKEGGLIGLDLAREEGNFASMTMTYKEVK